MDEREIVALRDEYLAQLGRIDERDASGPLVAKATELLRSRYWAKASWRERGKILDTVGWLLRAHESRTAKLH